MSLYELFVGLRYLKAKKSQRFISFNTPFSVVIVFRESLSSSWS